MNKRLEQRRSVGCQDLKYHFLFRKDFPVYEKLKSEFPEIIKQLSERPRHYLGFLSPNEAFEGISIEKVLDQSFREARNTRKMMNRKFECIKNCK